MKSKKANWALIIALIITLIVLISLYLQVKQTDNSPNLSSEKQESPLPSPSFTAINTTTWSTYSHPEAKFSFKYPNDWKINADNIPDDNIVYRQVYLHSPDFAVVGGVITEGYVPQESGIEMWVDAQKTKQQDLESAYSNNYADYKYIDVLGQKAGLYKSKNSGRIITSFIRNGVLYSFGITYAKEEDKNKWWDTYMNIINSFQTN